VGVNMLIASGHTGQTLETFVPSGISEVTGVRIPSYATGALTYRFGRPASPKMAVSFPTGTTFRDAGVADRYDLPSTRSLTLMMQTYV
jgi:hypothetical protein